MASETGDCNTPEYEWYFKHKDLEDSEIDAQEEGICIYTAGQNSRGEKLTDVIEVKDTANGDITGEARINISTTYIQVFPDEIWRLHLIPIPVLIVILGSNTNFDMSNTEMSFNPPGNIVGVAKLVFPPETILAILLVNPSGLEATGSSIVTITVKTPTVAEEVSYKVVLKMLPWILEEKTNK